MTAAEAIEVFNKPAKHIGLYNGELTYSAELVRAFEMAIEALQTEQKAYTEGYDACKRIMAREKNLNHYCPKCMGKLEPCDDLISRQAAIDALIEWETEPLDEDIERELRKLPSVQQEPFINKPCVSEQACREDKVKILEKIRAEIEDLRLHKAEFLTSDNKVCIDSQKVLDIIDKHIAESECE